MSPDTQDRCDKTRDIGDVGPEHWSPPPPHTVHNGPIQWEKSNMAGEQGDSGEEGGGVGGGL